ncbi:hypothetical protein ACO22_05762 [Paracoccidioides brasiliensis]|uniref:Uncharacterized protein n=1 Tax=Paracoccidioides brasiliensis TaxID=121759 RepID=A0A1D2J9D7_PARBR|nr:hypothetical protein ACO22_05762 [Paracoccidioides brasiliensis]
MINDNYYRQEQKEKCEICVIWQISAAFPDRDKCAYERYETLLANISATGLVVRQTSESPIKMLTLELNAYQIK